MRGERRACHAIQKDSSSMVAFRRLGEQRGEIGAQKPGVILGGGAGTPPPPSWQDRGRFACCFCWVEV